MLKVDSAAKIILYDMQVYNSKVFTAFYDKVKKIESIADFLRTHRSILGFLSNVHTYSFETSNVATEMIRLLQERRMLEAMEENPGVVSEVQND